MFPDASKRSSKRHQSSAHEDSGYWFELPDLASRKSRWRGLRIFATGLIVAAALLLMLLLFRSLP